MAESKTKTLVIDTFAGALTMDLIGSLNSGLMPIATNPSGKLPFGTQFKKKGLQFIEAKYALSGSTPTQVIVPMVQCPTFTIGGTTSAGVCGFDVSGNAYIIKVSDLVTPIVDVDSISKYTGLNGQDTLNYGGGLFFDGITGTGGTLLVGTDAAVSPCAGTWYLAGGGSNPFAGIISGNSFSASSGGTWVPNVPRPFCKFLGTMYVGNGSNINSLNSNYTTVAQTNVLNPGLPPDYIIRSMQVSADGRYMVIQASNGIGNLGSNTPLNISGQFQQTIYQTIDTVIAYWNGTDTTISTEQFFKGLNVSAIVVSSTYSIMFGKDLDGVFIFDLNGNELGRIGDIGSAVYPPSPHMVTAVGKFFFFTMQVGSFVNGYMFDASTNTLYPIFSDAPHTHGSVVGGIIVPTLHANANVSSSLTEITRAKLYYFLQDNFSGSATFKSWAVHLQNYGGFVAGSYSTQVEEFGRKIRPIQARVFPLAMSGTQSFTISLYDASLNIVSTSTYIYAPGSDLTLAQGALTNIPFRLAMKAVGGFGVTIAPNGNSLQFPVEKIEIDYLEVDNPQTN